MHPFGAPVKSIGPGRSLPGRGIGPAARGASLRTGPAPSAAPGGRGGGLELKLAPGALGPDRIIPDGAWTTRTGPGEALEDEEIDTAGADESPIPGGVMDGDFSPVTPTDPGEGFDTDQLPSVSAGGLMEKGRALVDWLRSKWKPLGIAALALGLLYAWWKR